QPPAPGLVAELHGRTEGNPLFLRESLRWLATQGGVSGWIPGATPPIPDGVREVIGCRLDELGAACRQSLEAAAVLGREFRLPVLASVRERSQPDVLADLDEAIEADLVRERAQGGGRYRFSHILVRDVLYEALAPSRRAELHRRAGDVLEKIHAGVGPGAVPELARHFRLAAPLGDTEKAVDYAVRAAEAAANVLAHEEAVVHYEHALEGLAQPESGVGERRLEILLALGASLEATGQREQRRTVLFEASRLAKQLGRPADFAKAALRLCAAGDWRAAEPAVTDCLEEALQFLGGAEPDLTIRLQSRLAHSPRTSPERARELSDASLASAERVGSDEALCEALHARHYVLEGPDHLAERGRLAVRICEVAAACKRPELAAEMHLENAADRLAQGDRSGFDREVGWAGQIARAYPYPAFDWATGVTASGVALMEGRYADAESLIGQAAEVGRRVDNPWTQAIFGVQVLRLLRDRDQLAKVAHQLNDWQSDHGWTGSFIRTLAPVLWTELGDWRRARAAFEAVAGSDFLDFPRQLDWTVSLVDLAGVCAALGDRARAATLIDLLSPCAEHHAVLPYTIGYGGPVSLALAQLAECRGEWARAAAWFQQAREAAAALDARPAAVEAALGLARVLCAQGQDLERATGLRDDALEEARALGFERGLKAAPPSRV
ncbi:MAG: hypothetical protein MJE66_11025, partial [Proteobacteria bacterium]|nr:hypothetical protein [Pseudomonadota bacterium]